MATGWQVEVFMAVGYGAAGGGDRERETQSGWKLFVAVGYGTAGGGIRGCGLRDGR